MQSKFMAYSEFVKLTVRIFRPDQFKYGYIAITNYCSTNNNNPQNKSLPACLPLPTSTVRRSINKLRGAQLFACLFSSFITLSLSPPLSLCSFNFLFSTAR